ncbi:hypothetical protein BDV38DRAFT_12239 [Aspergillus pseudotamarii]|uniref:Uncharacterized protein n=1 Tax=Aspergillus pseudotamarii TaxID=132259 RepID=A0A5N6SAL0_ASPPS|nr:uncharacterized protein BDV38DRAFT_12239 [Aspergillus pseudotamarii]KAE8131758.1 hypothetical protein BDV38DRAFT_12239 [Aspergillus pseudotamarii]
MRLRLLVRAAPASWSLDPATVFFTGVDRLWIPNRRISLAWDLWSVALKPSILTALVISILLRNWQCCSIPDHATLTGYRDDTSVRGVAVAIGIDTPPFTSIHAKGSVANGDGRETFLGDDPLGKGMRRGGPRDDDDGCRPIAWHHFLFIRFSSFHTIPMGLFDFFFSLFFFIIFLFYLSFLVNLVNSLHISHATGTWMSMHRFLKIDHRYLICFIDPQSWSWKADSPSKVHQHHLILEICQILLAYISYQIEELIT